MKWSGSFPWSEGGIEWGGGGGKGGGDRKINEQMIKTKQRQYAITLFLTGQIYLLQNNVRTCKVVFLNSKKPKMIFILFYFFQYKKKNLFNECYPTYFIERCIPIYMMYNVVWLARMIQSKQQSYFFTFSIDNKRVTAGES